MCIRDRVNDYYTQRLTGEHVTFLLQKTRVEEMHVSVIEFYLPYIAKNYYVCSNEYIHVTLGRKLDF